MFEFKCDGCGEVFSKLIDDRITEGAECKLCGSNDTYRIISITRGFEFKGNGFYETDYKNK